MTHDMWNVTCDSWHITRDMWHMARNMCHVTHDMWGKVNLLSKVQLPSSNGLEVKVFWRYFHKGFFGYVALNDFDFDQAQLGVGRMFEFHKGSMFVDPKIVYDLGMETTNLQIGFGLKF